MGKVAGLSGVAELLEHLEHLECSAGSSSYSSSEELSGWLSGQRASDACVRLYVRV